MRRAPTIVALALVLAAGCGRCRPGGAGPSAERFVPADAVVAVVIPELRRAAVEAAALHATLSGFPGAGDLAAARGALAAQLGLDPLDPAALERAGIAPGGAAAVAWLAPGPGAPDRRGAPLVVLPVADAGRLDALLARLARDRLGAAVRTDEDQGGRAIVAFRTAPGAPPALSYARVDRTAILVPGARGPEAIAAAIARGGTHDASLAGSAAFGRARRALGDDATAIAFVPPGSPAVPAGWPLRDGVAAGITFGAARLRVVLAVLPGAHEARFRALAAEGGRGPDLAARLDPAAPVRGRWDGDPAALGALALPLLPPRERERLAARGLDLERDLFDQALPGAAGALSLNPGLRVADLSADAVRADPLRALRFAAVARLRDPEAARAASARLARGPGPAYRVATPSGTFAWRIDGDRLAVVGGGPGDLERLVARLDGAGDPAAPPTAAARAALAGGLGGVAIDPARLAAEVRALPAEAFGTGPGGFVLRSVVERLLAPAERLAALSARADLAEGTLRIAIEAEARQEARAP